MAFFQLIPTNPNFDFIGKFKLFVLLSIITVGASIAGMFTKGFNLGIDFTGGSFAQVRFKEVQTSEEVRALVASVGEADASVVTMGEGNREYLITTRTPKDVKGADTFQNKLSAKVGADKMEVLQVDSVGAKVGKELKWSAILALFYSIILIMIYIWFRFDIRFAPGATIAMIHDIILAAGFYLFTGKEFTITSVAALLTIAGYSVNDTIVIYDRVRELMKQGGDVLPIAQTINKAINLTLSRTLLTSLITFISIIPIVIICRGEIQSFSIAMLVGIFVGSYSTIYIAAPFTIYVHSFLEKRKRSGGLPKPVTA